VEIVTSSKWQATATELLAAVAWGLVVLGLTLVLLLLGAIVLPAQAYETSKPTGENYAFSMDEQ
jgi:hypothetical protein